MLTTKSKKKPKIKILDGGLGRQLQKIGAPFRQPEWSALSLIEAPELVEKVHKQFLHAGCNIMTTNSYAVVPFHIGQTRFNRDGATLLKKAGTIAQLAKKTYDDPNIKIAAGIPPLFGSYQPHLFDSKLFSKSLKMFCENLLPFSDLILVETIGSFFEAETIINFLKNFTEYPLWVSFNLQNNTENPIPLLPSGEPLNLVLKKIDYESIAMILFNCCCPEIMSPAIKLTKKNIPKHIKIGVYPNAFVLDPISQKQQANKNLRHIRNELTPKDFLTFSTQWIEDGASLIGGCCGIGPEYISQLKKINYQN